MSENNPVLEINSVTLSYGKKTVVSDASLNVNKGEIFGLIGLNGEGKTTLIKSLLGLRTVNGGTMTLAGKKKDITYLPERFEPPEFLTGYEFLNLSLKFYGQAIDKESALSIFNQMHIEEEALNKRIGTYSKGMRQKLGLLCSLLSPCDFLVLDEPMSGLDPLARALVKDRLLAAKKEGRTIFLSSHILADMDEICDRVAILHAGDIRFVGTPAQMHKESTQKNLERAFLHYIEKTKAA